MDRREFLYLIGLAGAFGAVGCATADAPPAVAVRTGLRLHVDASDYAKTVDAEDRSVSAVDNLADPGRAVPLRQSVRDLRPEFVTDIGDKASFRFSATSVLAGLEIGGGSGAGTVMVVLTLLEGGAGGTIVSALGSGGPEYLTVSTSGLLSVRGSGDRELNSTYELPTGTPVVVAWTFDDSGIVQFFANGTLCGGYSDVGRPLADADIVLGAADGYDSVACDLAEVLVWDRAFDGFELRRMFTALGQKWDVRIAPLVSIAATVPFSHAPFKGSNIHPKAVDIPGPSWRNLWSGWDWDWIRNSVDRAVDQGADTIRIIGDVEAVYLGMIGIDEYIVRLRQLADYCGTKQCELYYCMLDMRHMGEATPEFVESFFDDLGIVLADVPNLLAIELCNEVASAYEKVGRDRAIDLMRRFAGRLRNAAPNVSLSISEVNAADFLQKIGARDEFEVYAPIVDVFDVHVYSPPHVSGRTNALAGYELATDRPLIFGEVGADMDSPDPAGTYRDFAGLAESSKMVVGVVQWAAVNDGFGLYSESTNELRPEVAAAWAQLRVGKAG